MFSSIGNDSNEKHQQLWKIVVLAAGPAAVVGFTAGLIVLLAILIRNRRRLKHLCYGGMLSRIHTSYVMEDFMPCSCVHFPVSNNIHLTQLPRNFGKALKFINL